jgi:integral membrane protein
MLKLFSTNIGRLRLIAWCEGVSLIVLVGIAVPLKYFFSNSGLVKTIGPIHGSLFLLFLFLSLSVGVEQHWKFRETTWKVLVACFVPFGTFYIDYKILSKLKDPQSIK